MEFFSESAAAGSGALLRKPLERPKPERRRPPTSETAVQRVWGQQELRDPGKRIKTQRER